MKKIIFLLMIILIPATIFFLITILNDKNINIVEVEKELVMIGDTKYNNVQDAIDASKNHEIIDIYEDITECLTIENKEITIRGNNHTLTSLPTVNKKAIIVLINSNLILNDLIVDGQSLLDESFYCYAIYAINSDLFLDNVSILNFNHHEKKYNNYPNGGGIYFFVDEENKKLDLNRVLISNYHTVGIYIINKILTEIEIILDKIKINSPNLNQDNKRIGLIIDGNISGELKNSIFENINSTDGDSAAILLKTKQSNFMYYNNQFINVQNNIK